MARYKYQGTFKDGNGRVVGTATTSDGVAGTISVYLAGGTTAASVYTASAGGVAVNSVSTDTHGYFYFWVDDGDYVGTQRFKITLSHSDFESKTYDNLRILDNTAKVTVDLYISAAGIKAPGTKPAVEALLGLTSVWEFSNEAVAGNQESIAGTLKLPSQMDKTTAPVFKIGWSANGVSPGNVKWQLEYLYISPGEATNAAAQATLTKTDTASATSNGFIISAFAALALPSTSDQDKLFKVTRLSDDAADTIADKID